ncbi:hypothetical protein APUTEX25_004119 [Auxenochlorella protothecoides]|uniref:Uncharacterized protein n=1 Tax=Auxenochlorella protothecoides TaxID=3075 RepID=A0A3M7L5I6_AUXPR|nr:hypothetical protein APUTEX25_004119 [Auxenochlorella protothecoides]|eukprot:RMZ57285.1 hypothetical protein APUTEX25_004119 [Auxenochlorella protothecoides]
MGLSMQAIRVSNFEVMSMRSTEVLTAVECLAVGQKACTADSNGNIGSDNKGKNNFGTKNIGNDNIGNSNVGTANWGNSNHGTGNRCFNKTGNTKVINNCSLFEFRKDAWVLYFPPPPVKKERLMTSFSPQSATTMIVDESMPVKLRDEYALGSAAVMSTNNDFKEVVPLTLLNHYSPPPLGAAPPPPTFGSITGTTITSFTPDLGYFAFLTADGAIIQSTSQMFMSSPYGYTTTLDASRAALASYAQAVAIKNGAGSTNVLTLNW